MSVRNLQRELHMSVCNLQRKLYMSVRNLQRKLYMSVRNLQREKQWRLKLQRQIKVKIWCTNDKFWHLSLAIRLKPKYLSRPFFTFSFWVDQFCVWLQLVLPWVQTLFICCLVALTGSPSFACSTYSLVAATGFPDSSMIGLPVASSSWPLCLKADFQLSSNCASDVARLELARNWQVKSSWHAIEILRANQAGTQFKAPSRCLFVVFLN